MKNRENKLVRQQVLFVILLIIAAATVALFEAGVLNSGGLATYDTNRYIIEVAAILLTIGLIPLAGKRFGVSMKKVKDADDETFLKTLCRELEIRLALLFVVLMTNIGLYYGSGNKNMIYWVLIPFVAYILAFPIKKYLDREKE